jgi:hypothetical protein
MNDLSRRDRVLIVIATIAVVAWLILSGGYAGG